MAPIAKVLLTAVLVAASSPGRAGEGVGVGGGVTDEIDGQRTPVVTVSWLGAARHPWEFSAGYLGDRDRPVSGRAPVTVFVAVSKRLTWRGWFASGGVALIDRDSDVLSGHGQFYTGAGYAGSRWALSLRHLSNGDTGGDNLGETFVLLEYRF